MALEELENVPENNDRIFRTPLSGSIPLPNLDF